MKTIELKLANIETVRALHIYMQYMLELPAYYGRNLDALHDLLGEIGEETAVIVSTQGVCGECVSYLPRLVRVMEDAAQENPHLTVTVK